MNPANLPFDSEAMLEGLRGWVECESPTWDAGAVERLVERFGGLKPTWAVPGCTWYSATSAGSTW